MRHAAAASDPRSSRPRDLAPCGVGTGSPANRVALALSFTVVVLFAGVLRFSSLDFGRDVPLARPDEPGVVEGLHALHDGTAFPSLVLYGGGYFYPLYSFLTIVSQVEGSDLLAVPRPTPFGTIVLIRGWSALLSLASVVLVFVCGARLGGGACGILAAILIASAPLAVRESHFAKADAAAAFGVAVFLLSVALGARARVARALLVGAATALALNSKVIVGVIPAALLALARPQGSREEGTDWKQIVFGVGALVVVTIALNAFWMSAPALNWSFARATTRALSTTDWLAGSDVVGGPLLYHAMVSLRHGCGSFMALLAVPALVYGWRSGGAARVVAVFAAAEWLKLLASPMVLARFFLPIVPALAILAALAVTALVNRWGPASDVYRACIIVLLGLIMSVEPLRNSLNIVAALGRTDTRSFAAQWIDHELPRDAVIMTWGTPKESVVEWGVPPLGKRHVARAAEPGTWRFIHATHVLVHSYPLPHSSVPAPPELARARRVAVFDPVDGPTENPVLEPLDAFYLPLARGSGFARPGPRIEIYELGK